MPLTAIVGAMQAELQALLAHMPDASAVHRAGREFRVGHLEGAEVVVVLSGIGKVAAATTASVLLAAFDIDRIVFTGTAGGLAPGVEVGDIVVADALLQHDMDASPLFPRHQVPLYGTDRFHADPAMADALHAAAGPALAALHNDTVGPHGGAPARVHRGLLVSGDRFVSTRRENDVLRRRLRDALAVEMEGAAVAQVCHDFGVPFGVVRTISDRADANAHVDFNRFVAAVASRCTLAIVRQYLRAQSARR